MGSPKQASYSLPDFQTESGTSLSLTLQYGTYGSLNASKSNAILCPSHYMADSSGYTWIVGEDKAIKPSEYFVICTEMFGNSRSSSPSNTSKPHDGPRFPLTAIRDNVTAIHQLLTQKLGISHLKAIVGFSMGAQQAFQFAISYPDFMDGIVCTAGTAKTYGHGYVRLQGQIEALTADSDFKDGEYTSPPKRGLRANSIVWQGWLFSQEWWKRELWKVGKPPNYTLQDVLDESGDAKGEANDMLIHMKSWQRNDVSQTPGKGFQGDMRKALGSIKCRVLYMPSETDLYFPVEEAREESTFIPRCDFKPIPSLWGHTAGAGVNDEDREYLNRHIGLFLAG